MLPPVQPIAWRLTQQSSKVMMDEWMENDPITLFIYIFLFFFVPVLSLILQLPSPKPVSCSMPIHESKYLLCPHTPPEHEMIGQSSMLAPIVMVRNKGCQWA